jgi:hypothetical protein
MMSVLTYCVGLFGLAYILGHSRISLPFRQALADWSEDRYMCPYCGLIPVRRWESHPVDAPPGVPQTFEPRCPTCNRTPVPNDVTMRPRTWTGVHPMMWAVTLLECPACLGTWVGFSVGIIGLGATITPALSHPLSLAAFSAGSNALLGFWSGLMQRESRTGEQHG